MYCSCSGYMKSYGKYTVSPSMSIFMLGDGGGISGRLEVSVYQRRAVPTPLCDACKQEALRGKKSAGLVAAGDTAYTLLIIKQ
jgi:hypothetical protein